MADAEARRFGPYSVELSNLEKAIYPSGVTKGALIDYCLAVADRLLPELAGRPLTLRRFPDGIDDEGFYQKRTADHYPDWLETVTVDSESGRLTQVVCSNRATLAYLVNQATVEFHPWLSRTDDLVRPDRLIFDLDPSGEDFEPVRRAAFVVRDVLDELGLVSFVKTTGSRGLHVVVPVRRERGFDEVREFARGVAELLAVRHAGELTTEMRKENRNGRIFLDWLRNAYGQTAVAAYSPRAIGGAPVATPLSWDELEDRGIESRSFDLDAVRERMRSGDPWAGMGRHARSLAGPIEALAGLTSGGGA